MSVTGQYRCALMLGVFLIGCDGATSLDQLGPEMRSEVFYQLTSGSGGRILEFTTPDRGLIATVRVTGSEPADGLDPDTEYWRLSLDAAEDLAMGHIGQLRVAARDDGGDALSLSEKHALVWTVPRRFRLDAHPTKTMTSVAQGTTVFGLRNEEGLETYYLRFQFDDWGSPPTVDWFLVAEAYEAVVASAKNAGFSPATFEGAAVDFGAGTDAALLKMAWGHRYVPLY